MIEYLLGIIAYALLFVIVIVVGGVIAKISKTSITWGTVILLGFFGIGATILAIMLGILIVLIIKTTGLAILNWKI